MYKRGIFIRASLALAACGVLSAGTVTYDLTADWANNSNPNGVWSYDQGSTLLPYQATLGVGSCFSSATGITGGYAPGTNMGNAPPCLPAMFQATGNAANTDDWQTGDVVVHAQDPTNGAGEGQATIIWTAPVTGTFTYSGDIWYAHSAVERSDDFSLDLGASVLSSGTVAFNSATGFNRSNMLSFSDGSPVVVNAGDQVTLVIQRTTGSVGALAGVDLSITETSREVTGIPEPVTSGVVGSALLVFGLLGRKLRRSKS